MVYSISNKLSWGLDVVVILSIIKIDTNKDRNIEYVIQWQSVKIHFKDSLQRKEEQMIGTDWVIFIIFIATIIIPIFFFYIKVILPSNITSNYLFHLITFYLWLFLLPTPIFFIIIYIYFRFTFNYTTLEEVLILLDIASGLSLKLYFFLFLCSPIMLIIYFLHSFKFSSFLFEKMRSLIIYIILLGITIAPLYFFTKDLIYKTCNSFEIYNQIDIILFGESNLFVQNNCWSVSPIETKSIDIYKTPTKFSQAYTHISEFFISFGVSKIVANIGVVLITILSLVADVLGIWGFIEVRKKKTG